MSTLAAPRRRPERLRRSLRALSSVLMVTGLLLLVDAGLTVTWQEPVSAVYAWFTQDALSDDLDRLERLGPTGIEQRALAGLEVDRKRIAFLARSLQRRAEDGDAVGRLEMPAIDEQHVVVKGSGTAPLRKGPGTYDDKGLPGVPGTAAIAGHRTTYGAPFRDIDDLDEGDRVTVTMPYARFDYRVERTRIVAPTATEVVRDVSFDRLVLTACHPLYSAAQRIVVFAKLERITPRGAALRT